MDKLKARTNTAIRPSRRNARPLQRLFPNQEGPALNQHDFRIASVRDTPVSPYPFIRSEYRHGFYWEIEEAFREEEAFWKSLPEICPAEYLSSSTTIKLSEQTFPSFDQIEYLSRRRANSALLSCEIAKILFLQTEDDDTVESAGFIASIEDSYMTEESKALKEAFEAALKRGRKESAWMEMAIAK